MAKRLDHVIVIDIESTCWDGGMPPRGQTNDIIEIGICPLELSSGRRLEKRSILVKPERSKVSPFCTELTTLTQEQVDGGIAFKDACKILEDEYHGAERLWASFGDYDRRQFEKQCRDEGECCADHGTRRTKTARSLRPPARNSTTNSHRPGMWKRNPSPR